QDDWIHAIANSILQSHQGTAAMYIDSIRRGKQGSSTCDSCQPLVRIGSAECGSIQSVLCVVDVTVFAQGDVESLEAAVVNVAAPSSLAAQDALLQQDLARADTGVLDMAMAQLTGDQAGFDAGLRLLEQALPATDADIAGILGG